MTLRLMLIGSEMEAEITIIMITAATIAAITVIMIIVMMALKTEANILATVSATTQTEYVKLFSTHQW